jgi:hypothetical protein
VRRQQDQPGDREPAMPDGGPVDAVEPRFHPRQRADEDQRHRQQQDGFGAEELPEVRSGILSGRTRDHPHQALDENETGDGHRPDVAGRQPQ